MKLTLSLILIFTVLISVQARAAETLDQESDFFTIKNDRILVLDGMEIKKSELILDFLESAISNHVWMSDAGYPLNKNSIPEKYYRKFLSPNPFGNGVNLEEDYPWLNDIIMSPNGVPRFQTINKWAQPITVSTQLPFDLGLGDKALWNPYTDISSSTSSSYERDQQLEELIERKVKHLGRTIENLTGLPVTFIKHDEETERSYARLRIVYLDDMGLNTNVFKVERPYIDTSYGTRGPHFKNHIEPLFVNAVKFTPYSLSNVEGYFIPDQNNEIQYAFCFIWRGHQEDVVKSLVTECLLRSLGLPDLPKHKNFKLDKIRTASFLGIENPYGRDMERLFIYGEVAYWKEQATNNLPPTISKSFIYKKIQDESGIADLSNYDKAMVSLLYREEIRPGMRFIDSTRVLRSLLN